LTADKFLIAVGTRPARRSDIPFDGEVIFDSDQILWGGIKTVPKRLIVVGAGVIGMEYASMVSIIPGTEVTVIDARKDVSIVCGFLRFLRIMTHKKHDRFWI
jgi:NAD(P) transhydrogenase